VKFGFSSYSFHQRLSTNQMSIADVIDWVADSEGEHLELAVLSDEPGSPIPNIAWTPEQVAEVKTHAEQRGVALSGVAVTANLDQPEGEALIAAIERVRRYLDMAHSLGITHVRHDVAMHRFDGDDTVEFDRALPAIAQGAKAIARYAAERGMTTSLENHGHFVQSSDRVRRVIHAVDEPNFRTTLDIGNFLCVDEDPTIAVPANLPYASVVHFKDFYVRTEDPGDGWFRSRGGRYLRGAIVGNGDIDIRTICRAIKESGFDGYASIEFEGSEDCLVGCARGIANAARLFAEV